MVTTDMPSRMAAADALRGSPAARLLPGNKPELADLLAGASSESIDKFIIHCRTKANLHLCSTLEIMDDDQKSEFKRGRVCAYAEMTDAITSHDASFGLSPEAKAGILEYFIYESGGEMGPGDPSGHPDLPREYYEKGMERAYRHVVYQLEKVYAVLLGLESMKKAVRPREIENKTPRVGEREDHGGISKLF
jgi:hypothetical protein